MSATGRGAVRVEDDAYETPAWCVRRFLDAWLVSSAGLWLEPGAGSGSIIRAVQDYQPRIQFTAVEKREISDPPWCDWYHDDFLHPRGDVHVALARGFDVVIGNPPYKLAIEFIEQSLRFSRIVAFLLRINFLASAERADFWQKHPADVYVLPDRPSFCWTLKCPTCRWTATFPVGYVGSRQCARCAVKCKLTTSDATEYAWYVWGQCGDGPGRIIHLAKTPESERKPYMGRVIDVVGDESEAAAKARHVAEEQSSYPKSELIEGAFYAFADGRLVRFEGTSKQFSFFEGTCRGASQKLRIETKDVAAWRAEGGSFECPDCGWWIVAEAAEGADACPFCGDK